MRPLYTLQPVVYFQEYATAEFSKLLLKVFLNSIYYPYLEYI